MAWLVGGIQHEGGSLASLTDRSLPNKGAITLLSSEKTVHALEHEGVTHVVGVPDNGSRALFECLWAHPYIEDFTSREEARPRLRPVFRWGDSACPDSKYGF